MNTNTCPACGHDQIEGGHIDIGRDHAAQECSCLKCNAQWSCIFKLVDKEVWDTGTADPNGDRFDQDYDGPDQSDREPSHGPDYWRNEAGEPRLG